MYGVSFKSCCLLTLCCNFRMTENSNITHVNLLETYFVDVTAACVLHAVYFAISLWCISANSFLLAVLIKHKALHTHANIFVANIAASDIVTGLAILTTAFNILTNLTLDLARFSCLFFMASTIFSSVLGTHAVVCATCERYIKICHPFSYDRIVKRPTVIPVLFLTWIISISYGCVIINAPWYPGSQCLLIDMVSDISTQIFALAYYLIMLLLLCFFNVRIFATILKHRRLIRVQVQHHMTQQRQTDSAENLRRTKLIGVVVLFTFLGYAPSFLTLVTRVFVNNDINVYYVVESFTGLLVYVNNVINPVIFGWKDRNIRQYVAGFIKE